MKILQQQVRETLWNLLKEEFRLDTNDLQFTIPSNRQFGDLSTTAPFVIAKREKKKPHEIGQRMLELIQDKFDMFTDIKLAGGGFLNFYFKKDFLFAYLCENIEKKGADNRGKVIVEHTSINPNKSAHIGHLRNSCLGDTLAKSLKYLGYSVEIQNYIDDTGIQMADVVWGLLFNQKQSLDQIKKIENIASYLWELYAEVHRLFAENEELKNERNQVHKRIESKMNPEYDICSYISQEVLKDHIRVMDMIGIRYDLLVKESDIIELDFFDDVQQILKENQIMYRSNDPSKKGCWVIKYDREDIEKIIIRSNQTITYIGKDIAYTVWKAGLFKKDFYYKKFYTYSQGQDIYITDAQPQKGRYAFGNGQRVFNVIDVRQSYLQNIISQVLRSLYSDRDDAFTHFSYEMVALTPKCVQEMGFKISGTDLKKSYVEVSGRKGIAVKADDLIEKLVEKSLQEVNSRNPEMAEEQRGIIAREIAVGALRYFMIKFNANSVIAFDFEDALAFEGDTGPYLQYTLVRINSILRKLTDQEFAHTSTRKQLSLFSSQEREILFEILLQLSLIEIQVELALGNNDLSGIASYTYSLCQKFNHYYHLFPIVAEKNLDIKEIRVDLLLLVKNRLQILLSIMGIPIPHRM